ncbi:MAG: HAD family hydrolase, partial [Myxococcota bacterium]
PAGELSERTRRGLAELLERGVPFTIATARSVVSVRERFDLPLALPIVCANGTFVDDLATGRHLHIADLDREVAADLWGRARVADVHPIVVTTSEEHGDRMFFLPDAEGPTAAFLDDRRHHRDPRIRVVEPREVEAALATELVTGLVAIDRAARLGPLAEAIAGEHPLAVDLNDDYYLRGYQWLTVHGPEATKGHGVRLLRERYLPEAERIVVFGDQTNDLSMFAVADHAVAMGNAVPSVKAAADEVIGPHEEDAVVRWLLANA